MKTLFYILTAHVVCNIHTTHGATNYVALNGGHVPPYADWATAATNLQAALDVAAAGADVLVTDGVYCVAAPLQITNTLMLHSVNGRDATLVANVSATGRVLTVLAGAVAIRGFTISNGVATRGGGIYCESNTHVVVDSCILAGNRAIGTGVGAGLYAQRGVMIITNCLVRGNSSSYEGGGILCSAELRSTIATVLATVPRILAAAC